MLKDRIIEKVLDDISIDPRIDDGIFDIQKNEHIGILCEYLIDKGIDREIVYEFCDLLMEKGKFPERQAYNKNGILVTFPTPQYKADAIKAGTHFENDPTRGHPNIFSNDEKPPATEPPQAVKTSHASSTKTSLPISTSTASPPSTEKSGEDTSQPAQQIPNAFTTAAPQQSPASKEPTELPPPKPLSPGEKNANKDMIKKMLKGDDYMLERVVEFVILTGDTILLNKIKNRL